MAYNGGYPVEQRSRPAVYGLENWNQTLRSILVDNNLDSDQRGMVTAEYLDRCLGAVVDEWVPCYPMLHFVWLQPPPRWYESIYHSAVSRTYRSSTSSSNVNVQEPPAAAAKKPQSEKTESRKVVGDHDAAERSQVNLGDDDEDEANSKKLATKNYMIKRKNGKPPRPRRIQI